jgi:hypothetical protein
LRLGSALLGTLTVLVAYLTAQALFPEDTSWQLAVPAFVAFLPMHAFITASVNNDSLAELLASSVIYSLLRILKRRASVGLRAYPSSESIPSEVEGLRTSLPWQRVASVACLLASGLLTKRTTTFAIPLAALTIIPFCFRAKSRQWYICLLIASTIGLGLWALIFHSPLSILHSPFAIRYSLFTLLTFASFWANFGWMNVPLDLGWYAALAVFSLLALCGLGLFVARVMRGTKTLETWQRRALLLLLLAVVLIFAQTSGLMIVQGIPQQGRYLFPCIVPLAVFFTLGLREWVPARHRSIFPLTLMLGMFVLDSVSLCCYIIPYFYG